MNKKIMSAVCGLLMAGSVMAADNVNKEENVYVLSDVEGNVSKIIVSGWLKNPEKLDSLTDVTDLKDIANVKGDETFKEKSGNRKIWAAGGNDIFYQGTSDKELPVNMKISYRLDGKKISAQELAGKSGKVAIRFDYKTSDIGAEKVSLDGKKAQIKPVFLVMSGLLLDNENFRNISVTTGKIINDGNRTVVVGVALPGLQENLGLNRKDFEFPDYVEVTADVQDFSLVTMMTLATNEMISNLNLENVNTSEDLSLMLSNLSDKLNEGIGELYDGVTQLNDGMHTLNGGLEQLSSNSNMLRDGAMQVFQALFDTAEKTFRQNHLNIEKLTIENYHGVLEPLAAKLILQKDKNQVLELIDSLDNYKKFYDGILAYTNGVDQCYEGSILLAQGTDKLAGAVSSVKHGSSELVNSVANFQDGSLSLLDGMEGFDKETLEKLIGVVAESEVVIPRLKATVDVTKKYQSFTGLSEGAKGSVRFIYRTSGI